MFTPANLTAMLTATGGETVTISLAGVTVKTIIGKFRRNFETVSPYETVGGMLNPAVLVRTVDMDGVTSDNTFTIQGTVYRMNGKPEPEPTGLTRVHLGVKL